MRALQRSLAPAEFQRTLEARVLDMARRARPGADAAYFRTQVAGIFGKDFEPYAEKMLTSVDSVLGIVNAEYDDIGASIERGSELIREVHTRNARQLGAYKESTVAGIAQAVSDHYPDVDAIAQRIGGLSSKAKAYAVVLARTQTRVVGRASKADKARIGGVFWFEYVGIIRDATREFCLDLVGTTHHIDAIKSMSNGQLEPVLFNGGGWNCIHDWEPDPFYQP